MDPANEAGQIRAFKRVIERGFVYRGLKPVYWCFDCGSSLAEFVNQLLRPGDVCISMGCGDIESLPRELIDVRSGVMRP